MSLRPVALLLILLTGVLAIAGEWTDGLSRLWCLPLALLLLGLAYEALVLGRCRLEVQLRAPARWPLGRAQPLECLFHNASGRVLDIEAALSAPAGFSGEPRVQCLKLAAGSRGTTALVAAPRRLGRCRWPVPALRLGGPLTLAWWPRRSDAQCAVTVVPELVRQFEWASGSAGPGERRQRRAGAGAELLQLREYRPGDPLRLIDWKASARRGRLVSRELSEDQHLTLVIAIDVGRASALGAGQIDRLGLYVNVAARLAQRAAALDDEVGLLVFAAQPLVVLAPARGEAAVARIRSALGACRALPSESNPVLAAARIRSMSRRRSLVVLLTDLDDASARSALTQAVRLLAPKHFPFIAGFESARIAALAGMRPRGPLDAWRALASVEHINSVAANVSALRSLGAAALTARPERLDQAVLQAYREFRQRRRI